MYLIEVMYEKNSLFCFEIEFDVTETEISVIL